ncbi:hypothetical protein SSS_03599 [Sarcoptes scabiei]|uniref:Uncharacterized protein n=1 Tax=Sarcoptes scabiei TaxID=52283 RepID=A0A834VJF6_SARSC|nr:hypothetical protein SSS_03599 [Sarcoptes scabiei]
MRTSIAPLTLPMFCYLISTIDSIVAKDSLYECPGQSAIEILGWESLYDGFVRIFDETVFYLAETINNFKHISGPFEPLPYGLSIYKPNIIAMYLGAIKSSLICYSENECYLNNSERIFFTEKIAGLATLTVEDMRAFPNSIGVFFNDKNEFFHMELQQIPSSKNKIILNPIHRRFSKKFNRFITIYDQYLAFNEFQYCLLDSFVTIQNKTSYGDIFCSFSFDERIRSGNFFDCKKILNEQFQDETIESIEREEKNERNQEKSFTAFGLIPLGLILFAFLMILGGFLILNCNRFDPIRLFKVLMKSNDSKQNRIISDSKLSKITFFSDR